MTALAEVAPPLFLVVLPPRGCSDAGLGSWESSSADSTVAWWRRWLWVWLPEDRRIMFDLGLLFVFVFLSEKRRNGGIMMP